MRKEFISYFKKNSFYMKTEASIVSNDVEVCQFQGNFVSIYWYRVTSYPSGYETCSEKFLN